MTPRQIELARHALGLPHKFNQSYRNRFVAGPDHPDFADWQAMVASGMAAHNGKPHAPARSHGCYTFWLTLEGAHNALLKGETLDLEDFPSAAARVA